MPPRSDPKGYYRELGVHHTASPEEIRQAFRERAKVLHPDQAADRDDEDRFKRLAEAYEVLKDPRRRLLYDTEALASEQARAEQADAFSRRGARPQRSAAATAPPPPTRRGSLAWPIAAGALGVALCVAGALLVLAWQEIDRRDARLAELGRLHAESVAREDELRTRYRASTLSSIDQILGPAGQPPARGRALFATDIPFQAGSAELDAPLQATVDEAVVGVSRALRQVPEGEEWLLVVEGFAGKAAAGEGVAVDGWETALLRIATVVDRLIAQGLPADRIAARFQAGFAPSGGDAEAPVVELKLVCCLR
ncbi:MAG: DnaJ domain-containing protein [Geminicoccaceae bacterium]